MESKDKYYEGKKKWRENNREKDKESKRKWQKSNTEKHREADKRWRERNREKKNKNQKRYGKNHPKKIKAHNLVNNRRISLKSSYQICGDIEKLERHHWRYDKPFIVATLCRECHQVQHIKNLF